MINVEPLMSLSTFIIGFIAVLLIARAIVEAYVYYSEKKKKRAQELGRVPASANKSVQRYYNRKGA